MLGRKYIVMKQHYKAVYKTGPNYLKQKKIIHMQKGKKTRRICWQHLTLGDEIIRNLFFSLCFHALSTFSCNARITFAIGGKKISIVRDERSYHLDRSSLVKKEGNCREKNYACPTCRYYIPVLLIIFEALSCTRKLDQILNSSGLIKYLAMTH